MADQSGGSVAERLAAEFGGLVGSGESPVVTAVLPGPAIGADPDRVSITFANAGANAVLLALNQNTLPASGILLPVNGTPVTFTLRQHGSLVTDAWFVSSLVGASALHIVFAKRVR